MQWAARNSYDCVLISEPPVSQSYTQDGYNIWWDKRVTTAVERGGKFNFPLSCKETRECKGDVQCIEVKRMRRRGVNTNNTQRIRICNIYSAPIFGLNGSNKRSAEEGNWKAMLEDGKESWLEISIATVKDGIMGKMSGKGVVQPAGRTNLLRNTTSRYAIAGSLPTTKTTRPTPQPST